ncbi:NADPH-dependent FMN reductase [Paenibacillus sp. CGMCC 1.16610]|uniref:NADPH-dependent FMN reductase n=1 Tax=Paenibacillus anseongense TaxID=2682845 RepID=A0ABW9U813_9BACL|nr:MULTISPECIES: NADPH-dependent FMN reductase [Paenibacillus]MBA2940389.1 NADPH-dependent FMN reductase [Paenibacillus sp. CGMCC 1.16610]MVQ35566.1 NADPH-dependent FMN reductase [Paenibacillus anseongense]
MAKVVIISGSPTPTSRLHGVIEVAKNELVQAGLTVDWIKVRDIPAEDLLYAKFDSEAIVSANALVTAADAVFVATPVYKASYTGVLKAFLDLLPQKGLESKIVLPLAVGGTLSHLLAIDYALKPVLSALGAQNILQGVYVLDKQVTWGEQGQAILEDEISTRLHESVTQFIQEIKWHTSR